MTTADTIYTGGYIITVNDGATSIYDPPDVVQFTLLVIMKDGKVFKNTVK